MSAGSRETIGASWGRTIAYLRVSLTDRCDLRCVYCMPAGRGRWVPRRDLLTAAEIERVARVAAAAGVVKVRLTGGEPLLRPDAAEVVARLRSVPGLREIALTTNGTRLAALAGELRRAGLDRINVSLDSLRPDRFSAVTRGGRLADVLAGLAAAVAAGFPVKLNTVVMRGVNEDEVADLARFGLARGLEVRFIEYMPIGCGAAEWRARFVPAAEVLARLEAAFGPLAPWEGCRAAGAGATGRRPEALGEGGAEDPPRRGPEPARRLRVPGFAAAVGIIASMSEPFCSGCDRLRLTADGRVRSCLLRPGEVNLRPLLRGGAPDEAILAALARAAELKPPWHGYDAATTRAGAEGGDVPWRRTPQAAMAEIGG